MQAIKHFEAVPFTGYTGPVIKNGQLGDRINASFGRVDAVMNLGSLLTANLTDATTVLQAAATEAIAKRIKLVIPFVEGGIVISNTINLLPPTFEDREFVLNIECHSEIIWNGGAGSGPGKAVFFTAGMRDSTIKGLKVRLRKNIGLHDIVCFDIDTIDANPSGYKYGTNSTTHITMEGCVFLLGDGDNNKGIRLGHISGAGGDISNCKFEKVTVYGNDGGTVGAGGLASLAPINRTQRGIQNEGRNVLNNIYINCLFAYIEWGYTSVRGSTGVSAGDYGGPDDGGNGAVAFRDCVFSHCNLCLQFNRPQNYKIADCRFEDCRSIYRHENGAYKPVVEFSNPEIDNCFTDNDNGSGHLFWMDTCGSLRIINPIMANYSVVYGPECIRCYSPDNYSATLKVEGGGILAGESGFYTADPEYKVYIQGVSRLAIRNGNVESVAAYADRNG